MKEKSRIDLGQDQDVYDESQDLIEEKEKEVARTVSVYRLEPSAEDHDDGSSEVTGDFDEDGNLVNSNLISCQLGQDGNGNGNGNERNRSSNRKDQHNKQEQKREYATFKYSSRFRGTPHEAVIINGEPIFLKYENNHLETVRKIEEINRILRPPCIEEYPYEPIEFSFLEEITRYERMALNETIETLYQKIKTAVSLYVDQDEGVIILISADILWTYFQDLFPTTHYYDVTGRANGIGKSTIGYMFEGIAYRAVRMTDPSAANLYRILGNITQPDNLQKSSVNETMEKKGENNEISNEITVNQKDSDSTDNDLVRNLSMLPSAPSAPSEQQPTGELTYSCAYCSISKVESITSFDTSDLLERHVIKKHSGWTAYPGSADIQKFKREKKVEST
jgi:hypothetical protein